MNGKIKLSIFFLLVGIIFFQTKLINAQPLDTGKVFIKAQLEGVYDKEFKLDIKIRNDKEEEFSICLTNENKADDIFEVQTSLPEGKYFITGTNINNFEFESYEWDTETFNISKNKETTLNLLAITKNIYLESENKEENVSQSGIEESKESEISSVSAIEESTRPEQEEENIFILFVKQTWLIAVILLLAFFGLWIYKKKYE